MDWGTIGLLGAAAGLQYLTRPKAPSQSSAIYSTPNITPYKHEPLADRVNKADPEFQGRVSQQNILANDLMRGRIPRETREMIEMLSAEKAWAGGFGTSERAGNLTARDLGLYSLQLQKAGSDLASGLSDMEVRMAMDDARMEYEGWASNAELQYEAHALKVNAALKQQQYESDMYQVRSTSHAGLWNSLFTVGGYALGMSKSSSPSNPSFPEVTTVRGGWDPSEEFIGELGAWDSQTASIFK